MSQTYVFGVTLKFFRGIAFCHAFSKSGSFGGLKKCRGPGFAAAEAYPERQPGALHVGMSRIRADTSRYPLQRVHTTVERVQAGSTGVMNVRAPATHQKHVSEASVTATHCFPTDLNGTPAPPFARATKRHRLSKRVCKLKSI